MPDLNSTVARKEAVKKHHQGWRAAVTFGTCGIYDLKRTMCHDGFSSPLKFCLTLTTGDHTIPKNLISFFFPFSFVFSFSYGNRYMEFSNGDCRSVWFFFFLSVHFVDTNINLLNKGPEAGGHSKVRCLRVLALIIQ